jgi:hypothetical protein
MNEIRSTADLKIGTIFKCSWNGMADYYELIGTTPKTVILRKIRWETCGAPEGEEQADPLHRWTRIVRDENGNPVPELNWQKEEKIYKKRVKQLLNGGITFNSPNYSGDAYVQICSSDYSEMYWG